jgi:hypothetical protein
MSTQSNAKPNRLPARAGSKAPSISKLLGTVPTLPGESAEQYQHSLQTLIEELEAKSVLQVYVAEKIHDCLWWIRRYEQQKRATIIAEMAERVRGSFTAHGITEREAFVRDVFMQNKPSKAVLEILASANHTPESLRQLAIERKTVSIMRLDGLIALQTKILAGLQASYEVAFNRNSHAERLSLQNDLLRRDLQAIDVPMQEVLQNGQRKANRSQPS